LLIPLDNERTLYRYHALFQELLARLLLARDVDRYRSLQGTASRWYEARGDFTRALRHAVGANDPERVFGLMRSGLVDGFFTGRGDLVRAWVSDLDLVGLDIAPGLMVEYVLALELVGEWDEVRIWLERLEQSLPLDREPQLAARYAAARALLCAQEGDFEQSRALCEEARNGPRKDDFAVVALNLVLIRLSTYLRDYDASRRYHAEVTAPTSDAPPLMRMLAEGAYADCEWDEGNLRGAVTRAERALADLTQLGAEAHLGAFDTLRTLALHAYEQDRLDDAELLVERYLQLSSGVRAPYELLALLDLARIWWARGERDAAFETLTRARLPLPAGSRSPLVQRIDALESRWRAEQGDLARALTLGDAIEDPWMRESVRVRCDIAAEDWERARVRHDALRAPAPTVRTALHDAVLTARIDLGVGVGTETAVGPELERGRAQSFLRTLVDEGPVFARALEDAARRQPGDDYVDALLATISAAARRVPVTRVVLPGNVTLSEREATVLRLLATRLTTREIAAELFVSQNTLKTHLKSIYRKLGADSRRTAVEAAWAYGVL
jgi:LuxR family maltose regulon positive regulatory protein